jgi:2-polyprenyl-6-methoxyphenol hydroxylase-like FAD-dependent oxidoreductase
VTTDVLIAGGGPNGLMLACELALNGVRPVLLEREADRDRPIRANGLIGRVAHVFDRRGLLARLGLGDDPPAPTPFFQFGGLPLDLRAVPGNPMTGVPVPQPRVEAMLEERARELGVEIRRGHELTAQHDTGTSVSCEVAGPDGAYRIDARWLVGADGSRSLVRKTSGIGFPGTSRPDFVSRIAEVVLPDGYLDPTGLGLNVPGVGRLPMGFTRTAGGVFSTASFAPGIQLVGSNEWDQPPPDPDVPMSLDELRASVRRVIGADLPMTAPEGPGPYRMYRHTLESRHADRYRAGRVLLVGDAAHIQFGIGGPGLNLGLQDAANLGWKLAAVVGGAAPDDLLDTYDAERRPVAGRVLMQTRAQVALLAPGEETTALRELFGELLTDPAATARIANTMAGADTRYDTRVTDPAPHPLAGGWADDLPLATEAGPTRLAVLQRGGRPLLLDLAGRPEVAEAAAGWKDRVDLVTARIAGAAVPVDALLVRPDGYLAWAVGADAPPDTALRGLRAALTTWFGPAR